MLKVKNLDEKELKNIIGGKYYGNGVSCTKKGCSVDWSKAWSCGANNAAAAWLTGGHQGSHKC